MLLSTSCLSPVGGAAAGAYIQSIQTVSITIAATTNTATITAVTTANTVLIFGGCISATTSDVGKGHIGVTLTNSTTVTATRGTTAGQTATVNVTIVEFKSSAVAVAAQFGTISLGSGVASNTATITSVTTGFATVIPLGITYAGGGANPGMNNYTQGNLTLTNSTTVTATRGASSTDTVVAYFCVIEFAHAMIQSMQHISLTVTTDVNTTTASAISAVTMANTMLAYNGLMSATTDPANPDAATSTYAALSSTSNVNLKRTTGTSLTRTYTYDVIEFAAGVLKSSVQRGTITLGGVTSNTATISSVNTANAFVNFLGYDTDDTTGSPRNRLTGLVLTNGTTVTATCNTAPVSNNIVSYEVIEFN